MLRKSFLQKNLCLVLIITFFLLPHIVFAFTANNIATVDLQLAISLHPQMALFDFHRIGFYKVKLGLTPEEFDKSVAELKANPIDNTTKIKELENELHQIINIASDFQIKNINNSDLNFYEQHINYFAEKQKQLEQKIENLKWESENSDLTSREKTLIIMKNIREDIYNAIEEILEKDKEYLLVLNSNSIVPYNFKLNFLDFLYKHSIPGINFNLFYAFYLYNNQKDTDISDISEVNLQNWFELTKNNSRELPITVYPLVLSGGNSITNKILSKIYSKYNIKHSIFEIVADTVDKIESLQFGKPLEKLVIVGED